MTQDTPQVPRGSRVDHSATADRTVLAPGSIANEDESCLKSRRLAAGRGTARRSRCSPACEGVSPDGQARDTIRRPNAPLGAATVTVSPACPPMSARPMGEVLLMRPSAGEASWLPTMVYVSWP